MKLDNSLALLKKTVGSEFSFALWQMPQQSHRIGIVDIRPKVPTLYTHFEDLKTGFLLNDFNSHHPVNPLIIKADLTFDLTSTYQIEKNPFLSNADIEYFAEQIKDNKHTTNITVKKNSQIPNYIDLVNLAKQKINENHFSKVVLSTFQDIKLPQGFDVFDTFFKACDIYPNALVYLTYHPKNGLWMGATPELLVSIEKKRYFKTISLAGTKKINKDDNLLNVAWTQKEIEEQAMVSRYIVDCFKKIRLREFEEIGPKTVRAGHLAHLKTEFLVDMLVTHAPNLGSTFLNMLHPTPAVCGTSFDNSLDFILKNENYDRGLFTGFLGPVNFDFDTHLFVNLRCMNILDNQTTRLFAGAGITIDSVAELENEEISQKMNIMKNLIF